VGGEFTPVMRHDQKIIRQFANIIRMFDKLKLVILLPLKVTLPTVIIGFYILPNTITHIMERQGSCIYTYSKVWYVRFVVVGI